MPNKKISELTAATAINSGDTFEVNQSGTSKKAPLSVLKSSLVDASSVITGTTWDISAYPIAEISLSANTALTTINGVNGKSRGILLVTANSHTLSINGTSVTLGTGETWVNVIIKSDGSLSIVAENAVGATGGGGGGATTLNAPTGVTLGTATSTTQPLSWTDTNSSPNENGYKVYRNTANNFGTATLATTTAANATSYTVTGLTASTLYYYWVVAAGNGTTTADSSPSTVASGSTGSAATVENLTLNSVGGVYTNSSQIFTVTAGGSSWHNDEKDAKHIAAGQDGYVQAQFATSDSINCFLGYSTINAATDYDTNMNAALWILPGGVVGYRDHGGTGGDVLETNSGTTLSANQAVRVSRTGGVLKLQKVDTDGTTVLSDIYTFSFTSTGILYIVSDMNGAGKLSNPKGYNITT
jgi:hypothetical protein